MRLLDLFCGAGGAAVGYHRAGFDEIVGIDIIPQKNYPFTFIQGDVLDPPETVRGDYDLIHASPPCQAYSLFSRNLGTADRFPRLIEPVREMLDLIRVPYIIENVEGAPLRADAVLCGSMFGLNVRRHRLFESSFPLMSPPCNHGEQGYTIGVYGHGTPSWHRKVLGRNVVKADWEAAMGIDWMTRSELAEAIPPAYTEFLGRQFLDQLARL